MKEAIGGGWMLGFVAMFIVIFSAYLAISVNYTKAFKVKNKIINLIEENEGFTTSDKIAVGNTNINDLVSDYTTEAKVYKYLDQIGYSYDISTCPDGFDTEAYPGGYCIKKIQTSQGAYYKVATFISFEMPLVWLKIKVPITGETKVIYNVSDSL